MVKKYNGVFMAKKIKYKSAEIKSSKAIQEKEMKKHPSERVSIAKYDRANAYEYEMKEKYGSGWVKKMKPSESKKYSHYLDNKYD